MNAKTLDDDLMAHLQAEYSHALEQARAARSAAVGAIRAGTGSLAGQRTADEAQRNLYRHPRPTGKVIDAGGPVRLLCFGGANLYVPDSVYMATAVPGDVVLVSQEIAERLVSLDIAGEA